MNDVIARAAARWEGEARDIIDIHILWNGMKVADHFDIGSYDRKASTSQLSTPVSVDTPISYGDTQDTLYNMDAHTLFSELTEQKTKKR
jgi:hypothetical protein